MSQLRELIKDWNTTAKIKAVLIGILAVLALFNPLKFKEAFRLEGTLFLLLTGIILVPLISKFNEFFLSKEIVKPSWNDSPFEIKRPLIMFQTWAIFLLVLGLSMVIGTGLKYHEPNILGLMGISFGVGIMLGINLTLRLTRN